MHTSARPSARRVAFGILALAGCATAATTTATNQVPVPVGAAKPVIAPDSFLVTMETSKGTVTLEMYRAWSPHGIDRFYDLIAHNYYDSAAIYRVEPRFVVQFGLAADPKMTERYRREPILDDPVRTSNVRGTVTFARARANSRTTQLFINLADNPRLDTLNFFGFPPIGRVVQGMEIVDRFNSEYSNRNVSQDSIVQMGNAYIARAYPRLDYVLRLTVAKEWPPR